MAIQPSISAACSRIHGSRIDGRSSVCSGTAATPCNGRQVYMCVPGQFDPIKEDACSRPLYLGVSLAILPGNRVDYV